MADGLALQADPEVFVAIGWFEKAFPEIPTGLPFAKGGEVIYRNSKDPEAFSPFEKGG